MLVNIEKPNYNNDINIDFLTGSSIAILGKHLYIQLNTSTNDFESWYKTHEIKKSYFAITFDIDTETTYYLNFDSSSFKGKDLILLSTPENIVSTIYSTDTNPAKATITLYTFDKNNQKYNLTNETQSEVTIGIYSLKNVQPTTITQNSAITERGSFVINFNSTMPQSIYVAEHLKYKIYRLKTSGTDGNELTPTQFFEYLKSNNQFTQVGEIAYNLNSNNQSLYWTEPQKNTLTNEYSYAYYAIPYLSFIDEFTNSELETNKSRLLDNSKTITVTYQNSGNDWKDNFWEAGDEFVIYESRRYYDYFYSAKNTSMTTSRTHSFNPNLHKLGGTFSFKFTGFCDGTDYKTFTTTALQDSITGEHINSYIINDLYNYYIHINYKDNTSSQVIQFQPKETINFTLTANEVQKIKEFYIEIKRKQDDTIKWHRTGQPFTRSGHYKFSFTAQRQDFFKEDSSTRGETFGQRIYV